MTVLINILILPILLQDCTNSKKAVVMAKKLKKAGFPFGIFFIMLLLLVLLSSAVVAGFFYFSVMRGIDDIETGIRKYSTAMAEASSDVADLSNRIKNYSRLKTLFTQKITENMIREAFFVLENGKIIAHSRADVQRKLKDNIINDEFAYNIDLILQPLKNKSKEIQYLPYNIMDNRKLPFNREEIRLLKEYIYPEIKVNGWLVTKAVYSKPGKRRAEKGIGTVNFIISRDKIYDLILSRRDESIKLSEYLGYVSLGIAFFISIIIFVRYRSIMASAMKMSAPAPSAPVKDKPREKEEISKPERAAAELFIDPTRPIKDAIPVQKS
jgi:hypothetical protein